MSQPPSIPGHDLDHVLGTGRSGTVWAARQQRGLELEVAVKVIHPHLVYSELDSRFEVEKAALASLRHPGVARVHESGTSDEGLPYLVLERIDGLHIDEFCDHHALTVEQRLQLVLQATDAVEAAHRQGILHRDLKPSNMLVSGTADAPQVKIIDFGLAKILDPAPEHALESMAGSQLGTPLYMAPEQFGFAGPVDTRADVYALGAVLYELLTVCHVVDLSELEGLDIGQQRELLTKAPRVKPSDRLRKSPQCEAIARTRGASVRRLEGRLRGELDAICLNALTLDREQRYPSASALGEDIRRHLRGEPLQFRTPSVLYVLRKAALRNRALTATMVLAATVIAFLGVRLVETTREARTQAGDARALADFLLGHFSGQDLVTLDQPLPRAELDRAYQELLAHDRLRGPANTARALRRLAEAYERLGDTTRADALLVEAIGTLSSAGVDERALALEFVVDRAMLAVRTRHFDRADSLSRVVLDEADRSSVDEFTVLRAHSALGQAALDRGRLNDAIASCTAALALGDALDVERPEAARLRSDLGHALNRARRHAEAAEHLRAALALLDSQRDALPRDRARVLHNLGVSACGMEAFAEAVPWLEEATELLRSVPSGRAVLGSALNDLANAVWALGDGTRALVLYLEALQIKREVFGERSPTTASTLSSIGDLHAERGRRLEAIACYRDASDIVEEAHGPEHPTLAALDFNLGRALEAEGALEEALAHFERAAHLDSLHYGPTHPVTQEDRDNAQRVRESLAATAVEP